MMSTQQIQQLSDEAAERAAQDGLLPYVPWDEAEVVRYGEGRIPFPNLGSHRPEGWEMVEHRMADKTGWGEDNEPAMTIRQLSEWVIENMDEHSGYAIIEEGQFQVVIGRFNRTVRELVREDQRSRDAFWTAFNREVS